MKFTSPYVNKASNWLIFVKGPIRGFVYIQACEFQYKLLNFTTKFGTKFATFAEKLYEINCNNSHSVQIAPTRGQNANQNIQGGDAIDDQIPHICPTPPPWGLTLIGA